MKSLKLMILAAIIALAQADTTEGCFSNNGKYCEFCYRRKPLYPAQGCGPEVSKFDRCFQYSVDEKSKKLVCTQCSPAFYLKITDTTQTCELATAENSIDFCLNEVQFFSGNHMCFYCSSEMYPVFNPSKGTYSCQPARNVEHSDPNCMWGAGVYGPVTRCYRCMKGYTAYGFNGSCKLEKELNVVGCLQYTKGKCVTCNAYEGYSMQGDGSCLKAAIDSNKSPRLVDN